ncbi:cellobiose dehydrogenase-like protein [Delitschia confertaspora ATCC 74209]|uniref:Cellobiose dehydrogenase-like protein n=1 Tax=Delitschia confertaspora ATCC 74209 TaxID=1513339 RepID=A0A9P4JRC8_9PLEO|nr:cellobiose dehydrogenase-like protein [Delitschia confertaspora ATCC 74209]
MMKLSNVVRAASLLLSFLTPLTQAQDGQAYTDSLTGISFWRSTVDSARTKGGMQWGWALPEVAGGTNDEYIGILVGALQSGNKGWTGISHRGGMGNALLLMAWVDGTNVKTEFRYAGGYVTPEIYAGNATLTQISHTINSTHFSLIYRCQWCWVWNHKGAAGSQLPTAQYQTIGWAQNLDVPSSPLRQHNNGQSSFDIEVASARKAQYAEWVSKYGGPTAPTTGLPTPTATPTNPATCVGSVAPTQTFDYIVVGAGAGGIPVADKLSESGKSVLLIEKGPPSSGRWNGTMKPAWLEGTNLTRFDVPGLCNEIWANSSGVACTDIDQMAGCILGGGTAVNAALWWNPVPMDWDYNFPAGWKASDMAASAKEVFRRNPWTDHPSTDGKLYKQEGFEVLATALSADGWTQVTANNVPEQKHRVYAHTPFMYVNAERHGPMASYLVSAYARKNFKLMVNTQVRRLIRDKGRITGVELGGGEGGYCGVVNVTAGTGRVILSAGTFGSTKILYRSGIGPKEELQVVADSALDGSSFVKSSDWINLPVGRNLVDHVNTDLVVRHPNVSFYDFYAAWDTPIEEDKKQYLEKRAGILAMSAPNIGPMFWEMINGTDGIQRSLQWQARVEPAQGVKDLTSMTISQYLGHGMTSRGVLSINGALNMYVSKLPYLHSQEDIDAVVKGIENLQRAIAKVPGIVWEVPGPNVTAREFVAAEPVTAAKRKSNHWLGTAKMGTDSALTDGTAVVDTNTQVYGTENLHVVDASVFPGHIVTNPSAYIVTIGEHAAKKILALDKK